MDVNGIKVLLHAWRKGEKVPGDVEKAREIAEGDPELKAWLDNEAAFDKAFADRLNEVEPPADLLGKILAAHENAEGNVIQFPRSGEMRAETRKSQIVRYSVSIAASFVIIAGIVFFMRHSGKTDSNDLEGFVDETVLAALSNDNPMHSAADVADVMKGLQSGYAPVPGDLPNALEQYHPAKYGIVHTQQGNIGQIGYSGDDSFRLLVLERRCLGGCSSKLTKPVVIDLGDNLAVTWAKGSQVYILVSDRDGEKMIRTVAHTASTSL
jgi:hypothetical protein